MEHNLITLTYEYIKNIYNSYTDKEFDEQKYKDFIKEIDSNIADYIDDQVKNFVEYEELDD
jgi:predicted secreted protein